MLKNRWMMAAVLAWCALADPDHLVAEAATAPKKSGANAAVTTTPDDETQDCAQRLTVISDTVIDTECLSIGDLIRFVDQQGPWRLRITREPNAGDAWLGGQTDFGDIRNFLSGLEYLGAIRVVSIDETTQTILLEPIPEDKQDRDRHQATAPES